MAGNQRAYRIADYDTGSISTGTAAAGGICWRAAACANRFALRGCWRRTGSALFRPGAAFANGIRAAGFADGARAWRAPFVGARAFDHRPGRYSLDARRVYENESGQDVCRGGLGDERPDAAGTVRGDSSDHENYAGKSGKRRATQTSGYCWARLRNGRLFFAGLATRGSESGRLARDLGCGSVRNVASVELQRAAPSRRGFGGRQELSLDSAAGNSGRFATHGCSSLVVSGFATTLRPISACCAKSRNTISLAAE